MSPPKSPPRKAPKKGAGRKRGTLPALEGNVGEEFVEQRLGEIEAEQAAPPPEPPGPSPVEQLGLKDTGQLADAMRALMATLGNVGAASVSGLTPKKCFEVEPWEAQLYAKCAEAQLRKHAIDWADKYGAWVLGIGLGGRILLGLFLAWRESRKAKKPAEAPAPQPVVTHA